MFSYFDLWKDIYETSYLIRLGIHWSILDFGVYHQIYHIVMLQF